MGLYLSAPLPPNDAVRIGLIGLGYVGLPLAVAFGCEFDTVGFDIDVTRGRSRRDRDLKRSRAAAPRVRARP